MNWLRGLACFVAIGGSWACVGEDLGVSSSPSSSSSSGGSSGASCTLESSKYMSDCGATSCGDVMECMASCPSCSSRCQVRCSSNADCSAVGAGTCKPAQCAACDSVCSGAPTKCPGAASSSSSSSGTSGQTSGSSGTSTATTCFRHAPYDKFCTHNGYPSRYHDCQPGDTKPSGCTNVTTSPLYDSDGNNISNYDATTYCCP